MELNDVIIALATPAGSGAISVVRLSGKKSVEIAAKVFKSKSDILTAETHTVHYGKIVNATGETIDDVLLTVFREPHSYTGENSVEISSHGNPLIAEKIIGVFLELGARLAEPGEFTRRAFLNGKMDLAQAEAVADLINSRAEASLKGARNQLDGLLSKRVENLRRGLLEISSLIEIELDFAEEDLEFISKEKAINMIKKIVGEVDFLIDSFKFGKIVREGINATIVGKPNVGKSSLLNYILKESRAIVSHIPGTTRDVITEEVSIDGILFKLYDTAGIRVTEDTIEKEGVKRSREAVKRSDLVLFLSDASKGFDEEIYAELLKITDEKRIIKIMNKCDLKSVNEPRADVNLSALTGEGVDELFALMKKKTIGSSVYTERTALITNARQLQALKKSREFLERALESLQNRMSGEFVAVDLRAAMDALGEIIGKVTSDDILNNIFSNFCIGK